LNVQYGMLYIGNNGGGLATFGYQSAEGERQRARGVLAFCQTCWAANFSQFRIVLAFELKAFYIIEESTIKAATLRVGDHVVFFLRNDSVRPLFSLHAHLDGCEGSGD